VINLITSCDTTPPIKAAILCNSDAPKRHLYFIVIYFIILFILMFFF